jgi:formylglycine-generating enzyme required for sulfatase activity
LRPLETFKDCIDCPTMVVIPAGSFIMGSTDYKNESPPHMITFQRPFAISRTIVTGKQYQYCVAARRCVPSSLQSSRWNTDSSFRNTLGYTRLWAKWTEPGHPIVGVSWNDAQRYSDWLKAKTDQKYRLPSEAEWERAARGGVESENYWWGNQYDSRMANAKGGDPVTTPVESYRGHPYGIFDMAGNAFQWVDDCWHENYVGQPTNGAAWKNDCSSNGRYVMRGGSFASEPDGLRSSRRYLGRPNDRVFLLSFRLARTL